MIRSTFALIVTAAACVAAAVPAQLAQARSATVTRVSMDHEHVDGAAQSLHGTIMIRTSAAHLRRVSHDGAPTARFTATVSTTCTARIAVSGRAVATTATPAEQAKRTTRIRRVPLGHGTRADGAWELVEQNVVDPNALEATGGKQLYGVAVVRIAPHRFVHVRAIGRYEGTCAVDDRLDGRAVDAIKQLLISASVRARVRFD